MREETEVKWNHLSLNSNSVGSWNLFLTPALTAYPLLHCASLLLGITANQIYLELFSRNQVIAKYRYAAGECFSCLRPSLLFLSTLSCFVFFLFFSSLVIGCIWVFQVGAPIVQEEDILSLHLPVQLCIRAKLSIVYLLLMELHQLCFYLWVVSPWIYHAFKVKFYMSVMQLGYFFCCCCCCLDLVSACLSKSIIMTLFAITWKYYKVSTLDSCQKIVWPQRILWLLCLNMPKDCTDSQQQLLNSLSEICGMEEAFFLQVKNPHS